MNHRSRLIALAVALSMMAVSGSGRSASAQSNTSSGIPTPASVIGHPVGADYKLARWETIVAYLERLGSVSDRVNVRRIGTTTEDNPYLLCEISSARTMQDLDRYRLIQAKLADARLIVDQEDERSLLRDAKTTILVTCGMHSDETAGSQMAMELAYRLATRDDASTREILDKCIILLVPSANPDGNNKIVDWYEQHLGTPYEGSAMPRLYQKYAGHDNNRDWFMLNLKQTRILTKVLYHEWHPTIVCDVHEMGRNGARFFVPPFVDPINPNVDPLIHQSLLTIGGHMAAELQEQGKTGVVFKAYYDTWWAGSSLATPDCHNIIGTLTEAASVKIASPVFHEQNRLKGGGRGFPSHRATVNYPEPWPGGWWRLRDIVDYELIACNALFKLGARYSDHFVRNHLTLTRKALRLGREEPPFAWLIPPQQRDPGAAARMLEALNLTGVEIHLATESFHADGIEYPGGTHVMLASQPYRPHLKDMMERQIYPDRRVYPGGPLEAPYDATGWSLPLQMGVASVTVVSPFEAELTRVSDTSAARALPTPTALPVGYATRRQGNADFAAVNSLLSDGFKAFVLSAPHEGYPPGSIIIKAGDRVAELILKMQELSRSIPIRFAPITTMPDASRLRTMTLPRTALYQPWTSNIDEGWTRFVLEQFDFPYTTIHNADLRAGHLRNRFDCVILADQPLPSILKGSSDKVMPPPYAGGIGDEGAMALERFVRAGGTLVLMDSATELATELLRVPVRNVVKGLSRDKFFCPGSLVRIRVDPNHPLGYGFDDEAAAYFASSYAFEIGAAALKPKECTDAAKPAHPTSAKRGTSDTAVDAKLKAQPVVSAATYSDNIVLLSGWLTGDEHLRNRSAVCEVGYGSGRIVLLGFRVQHRGQTYGTFKFLFNSIYRSTLQESCAQPCAEPGA